MDLNEYEAAKFELADILRSTPGANDSSASAAFRNDVRDLFVRLAEDRFNLVVAGRFSRGKTTLMNALLGTDRLPTGILPLTSVVTRVAYGSRERVQIEFEGAGIGFDIAMEALPQYVTENGNPGNVRRIRAARVELPAEILRRGFHFIDTPGLGSAIQENSRATEAFLPQADAVILVSGYDGPLTAEELSVARSITAAGRPLFFVLNKRDLAAPPIQREVEDFIRNRLGEFVAAGAPRIFSISAVEGLTAKLARDPSGYVMSGVAELEEKLTRFLIEEKHRVLLASFVERVRSVLESADPEGRERGLRDRLAQLTRGASGLRESAAVQEEAGQKSMAAAAASARIEPCPVCIRLREALFDFLRQYQLDLARRSTEREQLASSAGLCGPHLWLYASIAADRDICVALAPLVERSAEVLRRASDASAAEERAGVRASRALECTVATCVVCNRQQQVEAAALEEMVLGYDTQALPDSRAFPDPRALPSLCLPHLRLAARSELNSRLVRDLAARQVSAAERLLEDMKRYVLKCDGARRGLATDEEVGSAARAIAFIAGDRLTRGH